MKIYGLTVSQPWGFGFALGKRIENRNWTPPAAFGSSFYIALHGGKFPSTKARLEQALSDLEFLLNHIQTDTKQRKLLQNKYQSILAFNDLEATLKAVSREGIFGVARYVGFCGIETSLPVSHHDQSQWFFGQYGWLLEEVKLVKYKDDVIPCRGYQKLWTLPPDVLEQVKTAFPHLEVS